MRRTHSPAIARGMGFLFCSFVCIWFPSICAWLLFDISVREGYSENKPMHKVLIIRSQEDSQKEQTRSRFILSKLKLISLFIILILVTGIGGLSINCVYVPITP